MAGELPVPLDPLSFPHPHGMSLGEPQGSHADALGTVEDYSAPCHGNTLVASWDADLVSHGTVAETHGWRLFLPPHFASVVVRSAFGCCMHLQTERVYRYVGCSRNALCQLEFQDPAGVFARGLCSASDGKPLRDAYQTPARQCVENLARERCGNTGTWSTNLVKINQTCIHGGNIEDQNHRHGQSVVPGLGRSAVVARFPLRNPVHIVAKK